MTIQGSKQKLEEDFSNYSIEYIRDFFKTFNIEYQYGYFATSNILSLKDLIDNFEICVYFKNESSISTTSIFPGHYYSIKGNPVEILNKFQKYKEIIHFI